MTLTEIEAIERRSESHTLALYGSPRRFALSADELSALCALAKRAVEMDMPLNPLRWEERECGECGGSGGVDDNSRTCDGCRGTGKRFWPMPSETSERKASR